MKVSTKVSSTSSSDLKHTHTHTCTHIHACTMMEPHNEVIVAGEKTQQCREIQQVLPGTIGTSWPWTSPNRTIMRRGVAPDHMSRIMMLTVLASRGVSLGKETEQLKTSSADGLPLCSLGCNKRVDYAAIQLQ